MTSFEDYFDQRRRLVEKFLESRYAESPPEGPPLLEAIRYSLMAGGKRLRPVLVIASYESLRAALAEPALPLATPIEVDAAVLRVAAAVEMIHTYSLIHDDLPAMDNDDLRRGRPTSHKKYGEAMAILAGDALLTDAFAILAGVPRTEQEAPVLLEVIHDIAEAAGGHGMAWGQAMDLDSQGKTISPQSLENLHRHKTGCLIEVCVTSGAKLAGARGETLEKMRRYGRAIGLAFQVADDILDVEGAPETMGKNVGGDRVKAKATYPSVLGLEPSRKLADKLVSEAIEAVSQMGPKAERLREMARFIIRRGN